MQRTLILFIAVALVGCEKSPRAPKRAVKPLKSLKPLKTLKPLQAPGVGAAGSSAAGKVIEWMDSGGYTYLKLETDGGQKWAAVKQAKISKGQDVTIVNTMVMRNFKSKTLNRTFDTILFGQLSSGAGAAVHGAASPHKEVEAVHGKLQKRARLKLEAPIAKAPGSEGRTVAEVHAQGAGLEGKTVAVRGKIASFNSAIMGRNWIHLQDGTGTDAANDHDLTVTSSASAKVGQIVLVRGVLRVNKDFGSGYKYAVIIEEATVKP